MMGQIRVQSLGIIISGAALILTNLGVEVKPAQAQSTCDPPKQNEYLLLIVSTTASEQNRVRQTLPQDIDSEVCQYVDDVVTRVGGFEDRLIAEDWAAFMTDAVGLQTYVVKPNGAEVLRSERESKPQSSSTVAFNPEALGPGYAVLVDYFSQPELAQQVRQALETDVGLVSYGQRPYLLIEYTRDADTATSVLITLSRQGFLSMVVDSRRVTVIRTKLD